MKSLDIMKALRDVPDDLIESCFEDAPAHGTQPHRNQKTIERALPPQNAPQNKSTPAIAEKRSAKPIRQYSGAHPFAGLVAAACLLFAVGFGALMLHGNSPLREKTVQDEESLSAPAAQSGEPYGIRSDSFANMYFNTADSYHIYKTYSGDTDILDFETMEHKQFSDYLHGTVPLYDGRYAFYFGDTSPQLYDGSDGHKELDQGTKLYRYDSETKQIEKLADMDGISVSFNNYGMLLHDGKIYFIGCSYAYGDGGYGSTGGRSRLFSVDLATLEVTELCELYDIDALAKYYPSARSSAEAYMQGLFDNRIYFNIMFVPASMSSPSYHSYVTWYDLGTQTYQGEPEDLTKIEYCQIEFLSKDYLFLVRGFQGTQAEVYRAGQEQPVILSGLCSGKSWMSPSVFDDTVFDSDQVIDLNTKEIRTFERLKEKRVIARYGDCYIAGLQYDFEKIPVSEILGDDAAPAEAAGTEPAFAELKLHEAEKRIVSWEEEDQLLNDARTRYAERNGPVLIDTQKYISKYFASDADADLNALEAKSYIYHMMLNSIDYFRSAEGEMTYGLNEGKMDIRFQTDDASRLSYESESADGVPTAERYYAGSESMLYNVDLRTNRYTASICADGDDFIMSDNERCMLLTDGTGISNGRDDPTWLGIPSNSCLFPQSFAMSRLSDFDMWSMTGTEERLGFQCAVIEGTRGDRSFRMIVAVDTGIMLRYEEYYADGTPENLIEATRLMLDEKTVVKQFDPAGLTKDEMNPIDVPAAQNET